MRGREVGGRASPSRRVISTVRLVRIPDYRVLTGGAVKQKATVRPLSRAGLFNHGAALLQQGTEAQCYLINSYPMRAAMSTGLVNGQTPNAIASATMPSMRPREWFLLSLRLASSLPSTTAQLAHIASTG